VRVPAPSLSELRALQSRLRPWLVRTPVIRCRSLESWLGGGTQVNAKLELFQRTGTFKPRGALSNVLDLDATSLAAGITAVSAGNHAIAASYAAAAVGTTAKVVMMKGASPFRVRRCRELGAEIEFADDAHAAFERVEQIQQEERRFYVHPFEGRHVAMGTGTVGLEICEQIADFDTVLVPIGGGGLCGGISNAIKQINPRCKIIGVEPVGADSMHRSFASGQPRSIEKVNTIADSLGAPFAMEYSFELCKNNVDELVHVTDQQIRDAMGFLFNQMKLPVEPACAATTAALQGPLRGRLQGRKIVLVFCGSNIDWPTFEGHANLEVESAD
jgi:threonine dehydratase